jgi:hypothetical protein
MGKITSTKVTPDNPEGLLDEDTPGLVKTTEIVDNDNEYTVVTIYHLNGELVHRSPHVTLKAAAVAASGAAAKFN